MCVQIYKRFRILFDLFCYMLNCLSVFDSQRSFPGPRSRAQSSHSSSSSSSSPPSSSLSSENAGGEITRYTFVYNSKAVFDRVAREQNSPEEWMTLLRLCMTIISAPTMPSLDSAGAGGAASGMSVTWSTSGQKCIHSSGITRVGTNQNLKIV